MKIDRFLAGILVILLTMVLIFTVMIATDRPAGDARQGNVSARPVISQAVPPDVWIINTSSLHEENASFDPYLELHYSNHPALEVKILNMTNMSDPDYAWVRVFNVRALCSNDSNIKIGADYQLVIEEHMTGYFGTTSGITPKEFVNGTIVGIDDYSLNGSLITVTIGADPYNQTKWDNAWKEKMGIIA